MLARMGTITENVIYRLFEPIRSVLDDRRHITELMVNPDGSVWVEKNGALVDTGESLDPTKTDAIIKLIASSRGLVCNEEIPHLSARIPDDIPLLGGGRVQALVPPVVTSPMLCIRLPSSTMYTLDELETLGTLTHKEALALKLAISHRLNIIIAGPTGSGKTTLANALFNLIQHERAIVIEDTPEILLINKNTVYIQTFEDLFQTTIAIKAAMRSRPDRIIVGEIRDGATAIAALKSFRTGHTGCLSTIHAEAATEVRDRLFELMQEIVMTPSPRLIEKAVQCIVFIDKETRSGRIVRRVQDIIAPPTIFKEVDQIEEGERITQSQNCPKNKKTFAAPSHTTSKGVSL